MEGHAPGKKLGSGSLVELQAVLWMVDGWLLLTDEELAHHLGEVHGVFNAVSTYSELIKAVAELTGGAISLTVAVVVGRAACGGFVPPGSPACQASVAVQRREPTLRGQLRVNKITCRTMGGRSILQPLGRDVISGDE